MTMVILGGPMNIPAGQFKAKCLQLMDDVEKYHKVIVITKFGKPVAKLVPVNTPKPKSVFGCMKGTIKIHGDIFSTGEKWFADE